MRCSELFRERQPSIAELQVLKRKSQKRDHRIASSVDVSKGERLLLRERAPASETIVDSIMVRELRKSLKLGQCQFATLLTVDLATLRNGEPGRREPQEPRGMS